MQKDNKTITIIASVVTLIEAIAVFIASNVLGTIDIYFIESLLIMLVPLFLFNCLLVAKTPIYDISLESLKKKNIEGVNELATKEQS